MNCFIGCSGWSYLHWRGKFYPEQLSRYRWLEYYAEHFPTVEVNMTFYRTPGESLLKNWFKRTPENFSFTFKASRKITHEKRLREVEKEVKEFYELVSVMGEKLACVLWQLPPSMKFEDSRKILQDFLGLIDTSFKNVIEFRHKSFFTEEVYGLLRRHNVAFCNVSSPNLPETSVKAAKHAYFRFHGKRWYRYDYSRGELEEWASRIKSCGAKEVYCYFNNDFNAFAVKNARMLRNIIASHK